MIEWSTLEAPKGALTDARLRTEEFDRVRQSRAEREAENDAKMERSIRIAMAAMADSEGNCLYCGKKLDVERGEPVNGLIEEVRLHPMPYLDCKGPSMGRVTESGRILPTMVALPEPKPLPDLKAVVRPFNERDE